MARHAFCQPGGVSHTYARDANELNGLTEIIYNICTEASFFCLVLDKNFVRVITSASLLIHHTYNWQCGNAQNKTNKTDISYLKTSRVLFFLHKSSNWRLCSATDQSKLNGAVEWIGLSRQSHHVQLPVKVLTQQFRRALPVSYQNLRKQNYHHYLLLYWACKLPAASTALVAIVA